MQRAFDTARLYPRRTSLTAAPPLRQGRWIKTVQALSIGLVTSLEKFQESSKTRVPKDLHTGLALIVALLPSPSINDTSLAMLSVYSSLLCFQRALCITASFPDVFPDALGGRHLSSPGLQQEEQTRTRASDNMIHCRFHR